jgi:hypothetical protein
MSGFARNQGGRWGGLGLLAAVELQEAEIEGLFEAGAAEGACALRAVCAEVGVDGILLRGDSEPAITA